MVGAQTFNRYNLFYRLERYLLLHERGAANKEGAPSSDEARKYEGLELPPLPPRYDGADIPALWFLSSKSKDKKRSHRKSHGVASFAEIARVVASNWKSIDEDTMEYVTRVSNLLKNHAREEGIDLSRPKKRKSVGDKFDALLNSSQVPKSLDAMAAFPLPLAFPDSRSSSVRSSPASMAESRSKTPQVANRGSPNSGFLGSSLVLPSVPMGNHADELVSSVEQSFLNDVLGGVEEPNESGQPQTVASLLSRMASNGVPGRRASLPGVMPSSVSPALQGDSEPEFRLPLAQQRRVSMESAISQGSGFARSRRSTVESSVSQGSGFARSRRSTVESGVSQGSSFARSRRASVESGVSQGSSFARSRRASVESGVSQGSCQSEPYPQAAYQRRVSLPGRPTYHAPKELDISDNDILDMWTSY